jgi:hypothetical protein
MKYISIFIFFISISSAYGQQVYWQQEVNHTIKVRLDDVSHFLHAYEEVEYINNSPDVVHFIYFHLYPNAYSSNKSAFARQQLGNGSTEFYFADESRRGYIDSLDFKVDGKSLKWEFDPEHIDIAKVYLNQPLFSGEKLFITTPFRVKLPDSFSRLGHIGQQYQITQWFPKPAVYDSRGWHPMPYLDQGEFFSEFGSYLVEITLPDNYVVGATGNIQNFEEQEFLMKKHQETIDKENFPAFDPFPPSSSTLKTLIFSQNNIHDFAWFADKRYHVKLGKLLLPYNNKEVSLIALFNNKDAKAWERILEYMHDGVLYYSEWIGDYPYDVVTVVDGSLSAGAGMEYPTITVLGGATPYSLEQVTVHEIGHNWFYVILANNERRYPWLDEGFNSFYEMRYFDTKYPELRVFGIGPETVSGGLGKTLINITNLHEFRHNKYYEFSYLISARRGLDQPTDLPSSDYTSLNYGTIVYSKSAIMINHLRHYKGSVLFDKTMQRLYREYKFKHIWPEDFRRIFEEEYSEDLSWFFEGMAGSRKKIDYTFTRVIQKNEKTIVSLRNKASIPAPVHIGAYKNGELVEKKWIRGFSSSEKVEFYDKYIDELIIDPDEVMMELDRKNNRIRTSGLFRKMNPVEFKFLGTPEKSNRTQIFFLPTIGTNTTDNLLIGAAFYNNTIPFKSFNYTVMPMYSFGLSRLSGLGTVNYNIHPERIFQRVTFTAHAEAFAGYQKLEPRITSTFMPASYRDSPVQTLNIIYSEIGTSGPIRDIYPERYRILTGNYNFDLNKTLWRVGFNVGSQTDFTGFNLISGEANGAFMYKDARLIRLRVFYGNFLNAAQDLAPAFRLYMSGSLDPQMQSIFLDRAQVSPRHQMLVNQTDLLHGGTRGFVNMSSDSWLAATNLTFDLPFSGLISLYADGGFAGNFSSLGFSTGLQLNLVPGIFNFFIPVYGTHYENNRLPENFTDFRNNFRFVFRIRNLGPFRFLNDNLR